MFWECPALALSTSADVRNSHHLFPTALGARAADPDPTFWLRGLVKIAVADCGVQVGTAVWCLRFDPAGEPIQRIKYNTWQEAILDNWRSRRAAW